MIALGGALGALARYQLAAMIQARIPVGFPVGNVRRQHHRDA